MLGHISEMLSQQQSLSLLLTHVQTVMLQCGQVAVADDQTTEVLMDIFSAIPLINCLG